jgi:hypothetical protein
VFALATLTKPVALAEGLAVAALILLRPIPIKRRLIGLLAAGAGFVATQGIVLALFALQGTIGDYLYWAYRYKPRLHDSADNPRPSACVCLPGAQTRDAGARLAAAYPDDRGADFPGAPARTVDGFDLRAAVAARRGIGTAASGRFTPHYFIQFLPPLCLAAGIGLDRALARCEEMRASPVAQKAAMVALLALALVYPTATQARLFAAGPQLSRIMYGLNPFMEGEQIGRYLREHTQPDETIFIAGTEGQFLYHAQRKSATKFVFTYPLGTTHPRARQWQRDVLTEVENNRPRYIVIVRLAHRCFLRRMRHDCCWRSSNGSSARRNLCARPC